MNERIQQFAEQAGFDWIAIDVDDAELEKFAELIVRECIKVSDETGTSSLISDRIAEHFGFRS